MNAVIVFGIAGAFVVAVAWISHAQRTRDLDRMGKLYGVGRWEGEPNNHYLHRIYDRIDITGGKLNPWR